MNEDFKAVKYGDYDIESEPLESGRTSNNLPKQVDSGNTMDMASLRSLDAGMKLAASEADKGEEFGEDDEEGARISTPSSAMKFQPLQPLQETKRAPQSTRRLRSHTRASSARAIPNASTESDQNSSRAGSAAGSPENGFMNNMVDPVAATASFPPIAAAAAKASYTSHTPPTNAPSSYEASHFGKRPRSGVRNSVVLNMLRLSLYQRQLY